MAQEQPTSDYNEQSELDHTQPSPSQSPRRLDWRPPGYQSSVDKTDPEAPPVRRVPRPSPRRRRPPTEGAPAWVVGLGVGALIAVIILLVVAFVFSRRSAAPEPTPTVVVVTPTFTLAPRPTFTPVAVATDTPGIDATDAAPATAVSSDTIAIGGYVRVAAQAGLSYRESASTTGVLIQVLDFNTVLEVVGGPQEAGGYTWWQLRRDDGKEGWSAAGADGEAFLEPTAAP